MEMGDGTFARMGFGITSLNGYFVNIGANQSVTVGNAYSPDGTVWLVSKMMTSAAGTDTIHLKWITPHGVGAIDEPLVWDFSHSFDNGSPANNNHLIVRTSPNTTAEVDEIRIGPTWESVTGGPGVFVHESFDYTAGSLAGNNGGGGFLTSWSGSQAGLLEAATSLLHPVGDELLADDNGIDIRGAAIPMTFPRIFLRVRVVGSE